MASSKSRAALDDWFAQAEKVLQGREVPDPCREWDEDAVEQDDAA
jgi:hypothetical protein